MSDPRLKAAQAIPKDTLERLAAKLKDLVGEDFEMPGEQLVNEDGLPIIEFTEPIIQPTEHSHRIPSPPPLKALPKTEGERIARRKEMDAFFEALEEEERLEEEAKKEKEEESEFMRVIKEAKESAEDVRTGQNTKLNAGSLRTRPFNGSQSSDSEGKEGISSTLSKRISKPQETAKPKKAVSFAIDNFDEEARKTSSWGDVQQGRLRKPIGLKSGSHIMKLEIVEKFPSAAAPRPPAVDSDDEDGTDDLSEEDEDEEEERNQIEIEDALHQREIALHYHELRRSLGTGPQGGALGGYLDPVDSGEWDQENVPLDASLAGTGPRSARSRFNASRLSDRVLNARLPNGLAGELREASVENDQLITAEDDGASDDDVGPRGRRIIEGLKRGLTVEQVLADEPSEEERVPSPKPEVAPIKSGTAVMGDVVEAQERAPKLFVAQSTKPVRISRFKANRME